MSVIKLNNENFENEDFKKDLIEDLKGILKKKAQGFYYEEETIKKIDDNRKIIETTETKKKYAQPDTGAIHLLLKNLDETWRNDDFETMKRKAKEIELKEKQIDADDW